MAPHEAERAARIELGGLEQLKEQVREQRFGNWLLHSPVLQLVWPDEAGLFPWHDDFDECLKNDQPSLE
jgi:Domain of unknown function (DUF4262)